MTCPYWSTARCRYHHRPATLTSVSSTNQGSPVACRSGWAASASSRVNRCTHRVPLPEMPGIGARCWPFVDFWPGSAPLRMEHRSSTEPALRARRPDDHGDQRTSQSPGIRQRAPFEHRNVHMRPTKDLVDRMCAGQRPATGAPPGTRTPNPRIKSPNPVISSGFGLCQLVSFPQVSNELPCRWVSSSASPVHGHRALMEHRDRQSVLHRRTRWGSGATAEAADFGSAGSAVTVTWSVAPVRSDR